MKNTADFWDKTSLKYSQKPVPNEEAYQKKLEKTQTYFNKDMNIFEMGCGTGSTALVHAAHVKHILATDISPKMLEIAKQKAEDQNITNVTFQVSGVDDLEVPDASMDAVLALSLLHLVEDKEKVMRDIYRMLTPGGIFVSNTGCLSGVFKLFKPIFWIAEKFNLVPMVKFFSKAENLKSIEDSGFEVVYKLDGGKDPSIFVIAKKI
jgi:ubiquinone/menaquinone biosynthesis C-methylase UbiE